MEQKEHCIECHSSECELGFTRQLALGPTPVCTKCFIRKALFDKFHTCCDYCGKHNNISNCVIFGSMYRCCIECYKTGYKKTTDIDVANKINVSGYKIEFSAEYLAHPRTPELKALHKQHKLVPHRYTHLYIVPEHHKAEWRKQKDYFRTLLQNKRAELKNKSDTNELPTDTSSGLMDDPSLESPFEEIPLNPADELPVI